MAVADLGRRSPFDLGAQPDSPARNVKAEIFGLIFFSGLMFLAREVLTDEAQMLAQILLVAVYLYLVFSNLVYGLCALMVAIGLSHEFSMFGLPNFRVEDLLLPPLMIVWWLRHNQRHDRLLKTEVFGAVRIYMFFITLSTLQGIAFNTIYGYHATIPYYFKYVQYFVLFWLVLNNIKNKEDLSIMLTVSLIVCAVVGYLSYQGRKATMAEGSPHLITRAFGPGDETPNVLGGYYMMHVMIAFAMMFVLRKMTYRLLLAVFLVGVVVPFLFTYSRTSFVSLILGLFVTMLFIDFRYAILLMVMAVLIPILFPINSLEDLGVDPTVVARYQTIMDIFNPEEKKLSSWTDRMTGWYAYYTSTVYDNPLLGKGVGSIWLGVDSSYIQKFVESGLIGVITFGMILVRLYRVGLEVIRKSKDEVFKSFSIGYLGATTGLLVHAIGVSSFSTIRTAEIFWVLSGIQVAVHALAMREREVEEEEEQDLEEFSFSRPAYVFDPAGKVSYGLR